MAENTVNIPLLRKCVEWAEAEAAKPEGTGDWFQMMTHVPAEEREGVGLRTGCGSAYCIAGFVVATEYGVEDPYDADYRDHGVMPAAAAILGIPGGRNAPLFDATNTIEDVRRIAESLAGERL